MKKYYLQNPTTGEIVQGYSQRNNQKLSTCSKDLINRTSLFTTDSEITEDIARDLYNDKSRFKPQKNEIDNIVKQLAPFIRMPYEDIAEVRKLHLKVGRLESLEHQNLQAAGAIVRELFFDPDNDLMPGYFRNFLREVEYAKKNFAKAFPEEADLEI